MIAAFDPWMVIEGEPFRPAVKVIPSKAINRKSSREDIRARVILEFWESSLTKKLGITIDVLSINDIDIGSVGTGASFTGFIVVAKVFVRVSIPPFAVPPLSVTFTDIVAEPKASVAGVKVRVPFGAMAG